MKTQLFKKLSLLGGIVYASLMQFVLAYEVNTHEDMSEQATLSSSLNNYLPTIGLKSLDEELVDSTIKQSIVNWIRKGAHDEDDTFSLNFARYRNHFYDPLSGLGLNAAATGEPSPDWGLEDTRTFAAQFYSFKDARQYFYDALTLPNKASRDQRMARTFYTLGHVIHLLQDSAQPQHTRNDSHGGGIFGPPSLYEKWTDRDTVRPDLPYTGHPSAVFNTARAFWTNDLDTGLAQFTNRNFVSAGTNFQLLNGQVVANSIYQNPESAAGESSINIQQVFAEASLPPPRDQDGNLLQGDIVFIGSNVDGVPNSRASTLSIFDQDLKAYNKTITYDADPLDPSFNVQVTVDRLFTLNQFNFRAAYPFLIPKAVGYSAGLIDYFFRGKLSAEDVAFTDTGVSLRVKNAIEPAKIPAWQSEVLYAKNSNGSAGNFTVAFDYQDSAGKTQYGVSNTVLVRASDTLAPGQVSADVYDFILSVPPDAKDVNYRLIFRGKLGQEEDAVAVGTVAPMSGFLVTPNYVPADGITGPRAIFKQGGQWRLSDKKDFVAGNIDWKGWYRNGRPTKVLSWSGPKARSFPDSPNSSINTFDTKIYQNGELWSVAPYDVLGAALTKDSAGNEWIVAICKNGYTDIVYRRPNTKSNLPALYHPDNAPEGWKQIGSFVWNSDVYYQADIPWFFNGDGAEAQTIRAGDKDFGPNGVVRWPYRLHIQVLHDVTDATLSNEGNLSGITSSRETSQTCTSSDYKFSDERTSNGELYIAVDYRNNTPVFATFSQPTSYRNTFDSIYISGSGYTRSREYDLAYTTTISISGFTDIDFGSGQTTLRALDSSSSSTLSYSFIEISSQFHYLDLRHNLYSIYTTSKTKQATGPSRPLGTGMSFPIAVTTQSKQTTNFIMESVIFNENSPSVTDAYELAYRIYIRNLDNGFFANCNTSSSSTADPNQFAFAPQITPVPNYVGSWAVDSSNNIFSSQAALANNPAVMTGRTYNYLSNGDSLQVIPGASADPIYSKIGVIK